MPSGSGGGGWWCWVFVADCMGGFVGFCGKEEVRKKLVKNWTMFGLDVKKIRELMQSKLWNSVLK